MSRLLLRVIPFLLLSVAIHCAADEKPLLRFEAGDLPIILSAPHGGQLDIPNVDVRETEGKPQGGAGFVATRDVGTEELAAELAKAIHRQMHRQPWVVVARSHRKYIDMNRPAEIAYADPDAKPVYDAYHNALKEACGTVQKKFRKGLLLDLHGQATAADTVFRGTHDGKTVTLLRERFGESAHTGEQSLFGQLKSLGWKVYPDPFEGKEEAAFRGGYIVQTYGSHQGFGIDAMQLEFGADYRNKEVREKTASVLANAIADYAARYLDLSGGDKPGKDSPANSHVSP